MICFIVSTYQRPEVLEACLATLRIQPEPRRIIVADNSMAFVGENQSVCQHFGAMHVHLAYSSPYEAANWVVGNCNIKQPWLCFPSDDGLTFAGFSEIMLHEAERSQTAGLIYCDCVYRQDPLVGGWPAYKLLDAAPTMGRIDKTNFIVKRELFKGFPPHPNGWCDGALVEQLVRDGVTCAKAPGVLLVHQ